MKKIRILQNYKATSLLLVFVLLLSLSASAEEISKFVLFHTSDIHGNISAHPDPTSKETPKPLIGGFAALKSVIDSVKALPQNKNARTLYFDSGDFFQGTPIVDRTKGSVMIDIMNQIGLKAATIGNHEFDYSYGRLQETMKNREFDLICCNVFEKKTGKYPSFAVPYRVYTHNGKRIGVIGIDTPSTASISIEKNVKELEFKDPTPYLKRILKKFKRTGVDYTVVLSHLGLAEDILLAQRIEGIDLILGGHTHSLRKEIQYSGPYNTAIIHSGNYCEYVSKVEVVFEEGKAPKTTLKTIPLLISEVGEDKQIKALEDEYMKDLRKEMSRVLGIAKVNLYRGVNGGDSKLGSFISDAMRENSPADIAFINFGGVRQPIFKGKVTLGDVFKVQPFNNTIEIIHISGTELIELVEKSLSNPFAKINQDDKNFALNHYNLEVEGMKRVVGNDYGYLLPSNLKVTFDPTKPAMARITKITDGTGNPIIGDKEYKVALNDYLAGGGDGYSYLKNFKKRTKTEVLVRDAVIKKIESAKGIHELSEQRIFNTKLKEKSLE